jgi:hypothetical protein
MMGKYLIRNSELLSELWITTIGMEQVFMFHVVMRDYGVVAAAERIRVAKPSQNRWLGILFYMF